MGESFFDSTMDRLFGDGSPVTKGGKLPTSWVSSLCYALATLFAIGGFISISSAEIPPGMMIPTVFAVAISTMISLSIGVVIQYLFDIRNIAERLWDERHA